MFVLPHPVVQRLELLPLDHAVAVVVNLPDHVLHLARLRVVTEALQQSLDLLGVDFAVVLHVDAPEDGAQVPLGLRHAEGGRGRFDRRG